jgi:hypothetical protein
MNWRLLKRLSFFTANPAPFFQALTSALPSLSSLELALHFTHRDIWPTPSAHLTDLSAALACLASLPALRALTLRTNAAIPTTPQWHPNRTNLPSIPTPLWTTLSTAHGPTLTYLSILPRLPTLAALFYHPGIASTLAPFTHLHTLHTLQREHAALRADRIRDSTTAPALSARPRALHRGARAQRREHARRRRAARALCAKAHLVDVHAGGRGAGVHRVAVLEAGGSGRGGGG